MSMADPKHNDSAADNALPGPPKASGITPDDRLDEQGDESFPASDPHSDWAGPPS